MKIAKPYILLLIMFIVLGVYYPTLFAPFNSVDDVNMINSLQNMESVNLWHLFLPGSGGTYYRPLLYLTFIFDNYVWGLQASFMHLENILLHGLNAILVFLIGSRVFLSLKITSPLPALIAALLFALHPINTEAVNWISGRTDVLAGTFLFLSIYLLLRSLVSSGKTLILIAGVTFFLACLCKDSAVFALPGFLCLLGVFGAMVRNSDSGKSAMACLRNNLYPGAVYCIATAAYFVLRHQALSTGDSGTSGVINAVSGSETHLVNTIRVLCKVFGFYAKKLFIPWPLNFTIVQVADSYVFLGILALILGGYTMWRSRLAGASLFFSFCIIVPALLVPLGRFAWTPVAERYLYMATPTFCIALVFSCILIKPFCKHARITAVVAGLILAALLISTSVRIHLWQSNLALYEDSVRKSPDFMPGRNELALALMENGHIAQAQEIIMSNSLANENNQSIVTNLGKATVLINRGELYEAKRMLLSANYPPANPLYTRYQETIIRIDENLIIESQSDKSKVQSLNCEIIEILLKLHETTSDPFYYYRIGQRFLRINKMVEAQSYFNLAYLHAPANTHYRNAARRLSEKLKQ
ncbi:MAG: tetratricopeptide repeat protein [Geobacteraceae bacterium]